jgi:phosphatidylserine/phosphatidylglycerophosphate/cardiolipin synthase-like enzyme
MSAPFAPPKKRGLYPAKRSGDGTVPVFSGIRKRVLLFSAMLLLSWLASVIVLGRHALTPPANVGQAPPPVTKNVGQPPSAVEAWPGTTGRDACPTLAATAGGGCFTSPIRVYFAPPRPGDPDPIDQALLRLINSARESVACAFYELELPAATDALIARHRAGVRVGIVSDSDYAERPAVRRCIAAGIPVVFDGKPGFMHNKFCVVDGRFVWTGSTNITENCMYKNNNNAVLIDSAELARDFSSEFGEMFDARRFGAGSPRNTPFPEVTLSNGTQVECHFAPEDDAGTALTHFAESARERIDFAAFSFTSAELADAMTARMQAGVRVRGVFEKRGANSPASKFRQLAERGATVRTDTNPANMHDKFLVVDNAAVATGSFNFSRSADERNDENLLIIHDPALAQEYIGEVDRLMN